MKLQDIEFGIGFKNEIIMADEKETLPITARILRLLIQWLKANNKTASACEVKFEGKKYIVSIEIEERKQ